MPTQNNTVTNAQVFNELRIINEKISERFKIIYWILGAMLTIFVFFTILVLTLLFDVWGNVGELQGLHNSNASHAIISK